MISSKIAFTENERKFPVNSAAAIHSIVFDHNENDQCQSNRLIKKRNSNKRRTYIQITNSIIYRRILLQHKRYYDICSKNSLNHLLGYFWINLCVCLTHEINRLQHFTTISFHNKMQLSRFIVLLLLGCCVQNTVARPNSNGNLDTIEELPSGASLTSTNNVSILQTITTTITDFPFYLCIKIDNKYKMNNLLQCSYNF